MVTTVQSGGGDRRDYSFALNWAKSAFIHLMAKVFAPTE
jgi:hypothetical protein